MNVKITLRKDKKNANGLYPVVIQVSEGKRVERVSLGFSINAEEFDSDRQIILKKNSNNKDYNERLNEAKQKIAVIKNEVEKLSLMTINMPVPTLFKELYQASPKNIQQIKDKYGKEYSLGGEIVMVSSETGLRESRLPLKMNIPVSKYAQAVTLLQKLLRNELEPEMVKVISQPDDEVEEEKKEFLEAWDKYYKYCQREKAPATAIRIPNNMGILKDFSEFSHILLTFDGFTEDFGSELKFYLINEHFNYLTKTKGVSNSTAHNILKSIACFLNWAFKRGYNSSVEFKKWDSKKPKSDLQYLTELQLKKLYEHELPVGSSLDKTKDLWLFSAFSGMRWGDLEKWVPSNVTTDGLIKYRSEKVKKDCVVGLNKVTKSILKKYHGKLPVQNDALANKNIKTILAGIGFDKIIINRVIAKGTNDIVKQMPLSESITLHSGRRSFINLMIAKGRSIAHLSTMVGNDVKSLMVYYKSDTSQIKKAMDEVKFFL